MNEAFASLRLEGSEPTPASLHDAEDYIEGRRTLDEIIADAVASKRPDRTSSSSRCDREVA